MARFASKARGAKLGRPRAIADARRIASLRSQGLTSRAVARELGISERAVRRCGKKPSRIRFGNPFYFSQCLSYQRVRLKQMFSMSPQNHDATNLSASIRGVWGVSLLHARVGLGLLAARHNQGLLLQPCHKLFGATRLVAPSRAVGRAIPKYYNKITSHLGGPLCHAPDGTITPWMITLRRPASPFANKPYAQ